MNDIQTATKTKGLPVEAISDLPSATEVHSFEDRSNLTIAEVIGNINDLHKKHITKNLASLIEMSDCIIKIHQQRLETQLLQDIRKSLQALADETLTENEIFRLPIETLNTSIPLSDKQRTNLISTINIISKEIRNIELLTSKFTSPADACMTMHALWSDLKIFADQTRRIIHLTTHVLIPRLT